MNEPDMDTTNDDPVEGDRLLTTAEILSACGITHQVLYRYETLGLIRAAGRSPSGKRLFLRRVVDMVELIQRLNRSGYSLREIKAIYFKDDRVARAAGEPGEPKRDSGA